MIMKSKTILLLFALTICGCESVLNVGDDFEVDIVEI